jgi:hemerythrin-like domain-containing protein
LIVDLDSALTGKSAEGATATQILRDDHAEIRRLAGDYREAGGETSHARSVIVQAIAMQAELHTRIEEDVFYPAVATVAPDWVARAREDHRALAALVAELQALDATEPRHREAAEQLIEMLSAHMDEEERTLFPQVEQRMVSELHELGAALTRRKEALTRSTEDLEGPAT